MHPEFQAMFVDPVDHSPLSFTGEMRDGGWYEGDLRSPRGETWPVREGIPNFRAEEFGDGWTEEGMREWLREGVFARNWQWGQEQVHSAGVDVVAAREAAARGLPIVDIASGPGLGFLPRILAARPDALVLATDAGTPVLHAWKAFLDAEGLPPGLSFAGCNATQMPLAEGSVPVMTSVTGFGSVRGDGTPAALREAARVLAPDGILFAIEGRHEREGMERLCTALGWNLEDRFGRHWLRPLPDLFEEAGLRVVREEPYSRRQMRPDDNDWSKKAHDLGIEVWWKSSVWWLARAGR